MEIDKQKTFFTILLIVILMTVSADLWQDWGEKSSLSHFITEIVVCLSVLSGLILLWSNNLFLKKEILFINEKLSDSEAKANRWSLENQQLIQGLSSAIDKQLEDWSLTPSEKDIALFLLKGLSLKEIADIRSVSERTVRQQSISIYHKANLAGRAELSAFFLEDLLK